MPDNNAIKVDSTSYHGDFVYYFNNSENSFTIFGDAIKKSQALVRFGVMPDNNVLINKLTNSFGLRALEILKQQDTGTEKSHSDLKYCANIPDEADLLACWQMSGVMAALKPLEKMHVSNDAGIDNVISVIQGLKNQKPFSQNLPKTAQYHAFADQLDVKYEALLETLIKNLKKLKETTGQFNIETCQRNLLRQCVADFEHLQLIISVEQRQLGLNPFDFANETNTNATQNAFYAIQNHVYAAEGYADFQLYNEHAGGQCRLNTQDYPSMRKADALFAVHFVEKSADLKDAKIEYDIKKKEIKDENKKQKKEIDGKRWEQSTGLWTMFCAYTGLYRDSDAQQDMSRKESKPCSKKGKEKEGDDFDKLPAFYPESKTDIARPSDSLNALSFFTYEFGEYFSREMAAKHPNLTAAAFCVPSAYMGSVAMAQMGFAPHLFNQVAHLVSEALTLGGKIASPEKVDAIVQSIDHAWLTLTNTSGVLDTAIMAGFGLPKLTYLAVDKILNDLVQDMDQQTVSAIYKRFFPESLEGDLTNDVRKKRANMVATLIALFSVAVAFGLTPLVVHNHLMTEGIHVFDNIQPNILTAPFTVPAGAHFAGREGYALLRLLAVAKTSGLFIGKILGVRHFLIAECSAELLKEIERAETKLDDNALATKISKYNQGKSEDQQLTADYVKRFIQQNPISTEINKNHFKTNEDIINYLNADNDQQGNKQIGNPLGKLGSGLFFVAKKIIATVAMLTVGSLGLVVTPVVVAGIKLFTATTEETAYAKWINTKVGRFTAKQSLALLNAVSRFSLGIGYGVKTFVQAIGSAVPRVVTGLLDLSLGIVVRAFAIVAGSIQRKASGQPVIPFLKHQSLKIIKPFARLVEIPVQFIAAVIPGIPAALYNKIVPGTGEGFFKTINEWFKKPRALTHSIDNAINRATKADAFLNEEGNKDKLSIRLEKSPDRMVAKTMGAFIRLKNILGRPLAAIRNQTLRRVEHEYQRVDKVERRVELKLEIAKQITENKSMSQAGSDNATVVTAEQHEQWVKSFAAKSAVTRAGLFKNPPASEGLSSDGSSWVRPRHNVIIKP